VKRIAGFAALDLVLFIAVVIVPFGIFSFTMMRWLLDWYQSMDTIVSGPF
jgi:hypothetical protein